MPFTLDDLDRIHVRVGMGTKTLRQMSDTQFTAWLRAQGARGQIGVIKTGPGELMIPIEERVRVLNDLDREGFFIPDVMCTPSDSDGPNPAALERAYENLTSAREQLHEVEAAIAELAEIEPREMTPHDLRVVVHGRPGDRATRHVERRDHRQRERDVELLLVDLHHQLHQPGPVAVVVGPPAAGLELGNALRIELERQERCSGGSQVSASAVLPSGRYSSPTAPP